ncbi:MAG: hypothetical protein WC120_00555 [Parcubacteria group bacterium]
MKIVYSIKNIKQFLSEEGQGRALDADVRVGILERAQEVADNNGGMIMGGNTKDIIEDERIEELFEEALGSDMNQLAILAELARSIMKR